MRFPHLPLNNKELRQVLLSSPALHSKHSWSPLHTATINGAIIFKIRGYSLSLDCTSQLYSGTLSWLMVPNLRFCPWALLSCGFHSPEALPSSVTSFGLSECQASALLHDPFTHAFKTTITNMTLTHYQIWLQAQCIVLASTEPQLPHFPEETCLEDY